MKTSLGVDNKLICNMLLKHWSLKITSVHFIPVGDSAYSYKLSSETGINYYLKIVDLQTTGGRRTAAHMEFSLPLQRFVSEHASFQLSAPAPQYTLQKTLSASHDLLFFALYTFIDGTTLSDSYPMPDTLVHRIGQTLATLHMLQIPAALQLRSPQDHLTASFEETLLADLAAVESITARDAMYLQQLKELMQSWQTYIQVFLNHSYEYKRKALQKKLSRVVCHGDPWGGNIISSSSGQLILLDWESSVVAPVERDAYNYMGYNHEDFAAFTAGYHTIRAEPVHWNIHLLAYYAYRHQLRNLATWLHNLLHETYNDEQRANDLEMIKNHCLNRLENVERTAAQLQITISE